MNNDYINDYENERLSKIIIFELMFSIFNDILSF